MFTLETVAPTVAISTAGDNDQPGDADDPPAASARAAGEAAVGATVTLFDTVNGVTTQVGTATVGYGGVWSTSVTLSGNGGHSIVAQDTDAAGNTGTSTPVVFTLDHARADGCDQRRWPATSNVASRGDAGTVTAAAGQAVVGATVTLLVTIGGVTT